MSKKGEVVDFYAESDYFVCSFNPEEDPDTVLEEGFLDYWSFLLNIWSSANPCELVSSLLAEWCLERMKLSFLEFKPFSIATGLAASNEGGCKSYSAQVLLVLSKFEEEAV